MGSTVAITGVGGLIGRRLVAALEQDPAVERIVGLDVAVPSGIAGRKLHLRRADVRDRDQLAASLAGADVVVHLAFQVDPLRDEAKMRAINVDGTRNVVETAAAVGARKIVYVSSGVVYGAHPDNPLPITEEQPLRANAPFNYAEHKLEVERWLEPWAAAHPATTVTVLRPSIVAGRGVSNSISRQLDAPRFVVVAGYEPPLQFAHVDDVAGALAHVIDHDLPGAYNVASEGWLSFGEVTAIASRKLLRVPEGIAFAAAEQLWRIGLGEAPPGQVPYVMHPWVLSVDELIATGWQPRYSNRDALAALIDEHADQLVLGPVATSRTAARRVLTGAGVAGAAALLWGGRRVHRGRDARRRTTSSPPRTARPPAGRR